MILSNDKICCSMSGVSVVCLLVVVVAVAASAVVYFVGLVQNFDQKKNEQKSFRNFVLSHDLYL